MKKNCDKCAYRGYLGDETHEDHNGYSTTTIYNGIRCTNSNCIFFRSPCKPLIDAGLDNCKGFKEVSDD